MISGVNVWYRINASKLVAKRNWWPNDREFCEKRQLHKGAEVLNDWYGVKVVETLM